MANQGRDHLRDWKTINRDPIGQVPLIHWLIPFSYVTCQWRQSFMHTRRHTHTHTHTHTYTNTRTSTHTHTYTYNIFRRITTSKYIAKWNIAFGSISIIIDVQHVFTFLPSFLPLLVLPSASVSWVLTWQASQSVLSRWPRLECSSNVCVLELHLLPSSTPTEHSLSMEHTLTVNHIHTP